MLSASYQRLRDLRWQCVGSRLRWHSGGFSQEVGGGSLHVRQRLRSARVGLSSGIRDASGSCPSWAYSRLLSVWVYRSRIAWDAEAAIAAAKYCHFYMSVSFVTPQRNRTTFAHLLVLMAVGPVTYSLYHDTRDLLPDPGTFHLKCDNTFLLRNSIPVLSRLHYHIARCNGSDMDLVLLFAFWM